MPLWVPSKMLAENTEQGPEAEARKKKAFWVSILFITVLTFAVVGVFGILQIFRKEDENIDIGNSTMSTNSTTATTENST